MREKEIETNDKVRETDTKRAMSGRKRGRQEWERER